MSIFTLDLSEDLRAKLEAYRAKRGLRSNAQAIRHMIDLVSRMKFVQDIPVEAATPDTWPAQRHNGSKRVIGFDPKTGEPIYG